jgi:superfamily II DNA or RNA helicase
MAEFKNTDGKGHMGNLIALPLQGQPRKNGNSIFVDPGSLEPFADQWKFLSDVAKVSVEKLDALFVKCTGKTDKLVQMKNGEIQITLSEYVSIPKNQINSKLTTFLREELNFFNAEYAMKKNMNMPTYDLERYFKTVLTDGSDVQVPRGFLEKLKMYLREQGTPFQISDKRNHVEPVEVRPSFELFEHQKETLKHFEKTDCGILVAPPGSGKTIMGLGIIAEKKQPALILVHRKQIYDQWLERIENFLNIPKKDIGQFVSNKKTIKSPITVAMVQSLARQKDWKELKKSFGLVLVDECHHMPAKMFRDVITKFNPQYLFGLTATPKRKNNDEKLIYAYLGDIVYEVSKNYRLEISTNKTPKVEISIRETNLSFPFATKRADFQTIAKILIFDSERNRMIAEDIVTEAKSGKKCLILTERKEHVELLNFYLKRDFETIALTSDLPVSKRKQKEKQIASGHFQVLIATGQLLGEGSDIRNLDTLFLVFPFSFEGKLIQYIGRIERGEEAIKKVYDYRDSHIEILDKMFKQRKRYYNKLEKD